MSSLPLQRQARPAIVRTSGDASEEEDDGALLFGTSGMATSGYLLTQPVFNLIPPSPSDITEDDQFFDLNSEESVPHTSGSLGGFPTEDRESCEERVEREEAEEPPEDFTQAENNPSAGSVAEPQGGLCGRFGEDGEAVAAKQWDEDEAELRSLFSAYQVAPLPEYTKRSESNSSMKLQSDILAHLAVCCLVGRWIWLLISGFSRRLQAKHWHIKASILFLISEFHLASLLS